MFPASHFEARDGLFGLGGVSFTGGPGAESTITFGKAAYSPFRCLVPAPTRRWYLTLSAGDTELGHIETVRRFQGSRLRIVRRRTRLDTHVAGDAGPRAAVFGITSENATGSNHDSLGLNGASITVLSRMFGQAHWAAELQHRRPDLVIVNYGTNEADFADFVDKQYERNCAKPCAACVLPCQRPRCLSASPMDRGHKAASGEIETMPTIPRIVALQRRVARETGRGFFDTFHAAMGGEGTMAAWYAAQLRLVSADFIHPSPQGGKLIATIFTREIVSGLNRYQLWELH